MLELGCGAGLIGLVAAWLGAEATMTDLPNVLPLTRRNVEHNAAAVVGRGADRGSGGVARVGAARHRRSQVPLVDLAQRRAPLRRGALSEEQAL